MSMTDWLTFSKLPIVIQSLRIWTSTVSYNIGGFLMLATYWGRGLFLGAYIIFRRLIYNRVVKMVKMKAYALSIQRRVNKQRSRNEILLERT